MNLVLGRFMGTLDVSVNPVGGDSGVKLDFRNRLNKTPRDRDG